MSGSNCCFLTCIQISKEAGEVVWYSHLLKDFLQCVVIYTANWFIGKSIKHREMFFWNSRFFYDPLDVGNLISGSSVFSKSSLNIWKFMVHVLLKPALESFEHYFASMWDASNCTVIWTLFDIAFLLYWSEIWLFPVLWPLLSFPNFLAYWMQHFHSILF